MLEEEVLFHLLVSVSGLCEIIELGGSHPHRVLIQAYVTQVVSAVEERFELAATARDLIKGMRQDLLLK